MRVLRSVLFAQWSQSAFEPQMDSAHLPKMGRIFYVYLSYSWKILYEYGEPRLVAPLMYKSLTYGRQM